MRYTDPIKLFSSELPLISKPSRYLGGEADSIIKKDDNLYRFAFCFPDLYEIGMSNNAMRIIYSSLNKLPSVYCERLFAVGSDYEALLRKKNIGLYTLETKLQIKDTDILAFTIAYELLATNIINILDICSIPINKNNRTDEDPIIIAGGPAITNPVPYSDIFDAVWIGEAENRFYSTIAEMAEMKKNGKSRQEQLDYLISDPSVWVPGKKAKRNFYEGFSSDKYQIDFPLPVLKPVQDHGVVEIMRGCPNGCRFCHAGFYYRPTRIRNMDCIINNVDELVKNGRKEISLSSLSSGDFPGISALVKYLEERYKNQGVSFQLPSLKVETFPIDILESLGSIRKTSLTFAVETAHEKWQLSLNKKVSFTKIKDILSEATRLGFKTAKFYFMLGLPLPELELSEEDVIIDLVKQMLSFTKGIKINITLATFIPKPHTPYERVNQLSYPDAANKIYKIKDAFRQEKRVKVTYHSPYLSLLEGIVSRGDKRAGDIIIEAYKNGARFDAWDDLFNKNAWEQTLLNKDDIISEFLGSKSVDQILPWHEINHRTSTSYLLKEKSNSDNCITTSKCIEKCTNPCGVCTPSVKACVGKEYSYNELIEQFPFQTSETKTIDISSSGKAQEKIRLLFSFSKNNQAAFYSHHDIRDMLFTAFEKAGVYLEFSHGFNPQPRFEISEPISLGYSSDYELGLAILDNEKFINSSTWAKDKLDLINRYLPESLELTKINLIYWPLGLKCLSLSALYWGSNFEVNIETEKYPNFVSKITEIISTSEELKEATIMASNNIINLYLPFTGKREFGISSILSKALDQDVRTTNISVKRTNQIAYTQSSGKIDYFDYFLNPTKK